MRGGTLHLGDLAGEGHELLLEATDHARQGLHLAPGYEGVSQSQRLLRVRGRDGHWGGQPLSCRRGC